MNDRLLQKLEPWVKVINVLGKAMKETQEFFPKGFKVCAFGLYLLKKEFSVWEHLHFLLACFDDGIELLLANEHLISDFVEKLHISIIY